MITFPEAKIDDAFLTSPAAVKEAIEDGEVSKTVVQTAKKHALPKEAIGRVAELASYLLLGLLSPMQFLTELRGAGVSESAARGVIQDLNEAVFKPLLKEIKVGDKAVPAPAKPGAPHASSAPIPLVSKPEVSPALPTPSSAPTIPSAFPGPVPLPTPPAPPKKTPPVFIQNATPLRTMAADVRKAEAIVPEVKPLPIEVRPAAPVRPFIPPAPAAIPPFVRPSAPTIPSPPPTTQATPPENLSHASVSADLKTYGVDPYRELPE